MAEPSSHVPTDSATNYYIPPDAYAHHAGMMEGQDAAFDAAWPSFVPDRIDLAQDGDFWPPPSEHQPASSTTQTNPYYQHDGFDRSGYTNGGTYNNNLNHSVFDPSAALQSPALTDRPFRPQGPPHQGQDGQGGTIAPNVLQAITSTQPTNSPVQPPQRQVCDDSVYVLIHANQIKKTSTSLPPPPVKANYGPLIPLPKGAAVNSRFFVTSTEDLRKLVQIRSLNSFVDIGEEPVAEIARCTNLQILRDLVTCANVLNSDHTCLLSSQVSS